MMGLPYGEEIIIVGRTMWTQFTSVTDGQTDGRTERRTVKISGLELGIHYVIFIAQFSTTRLFTTYSSVGGCRQRCWSLHSEAVEMLPVTSLIVSLTVALTAKLAFLLVAVAAVLLT